MNKLLLVWNIIITIALCGAILSGCSSIDPQFAALESQAKSNRQAIEKLADAANANRQLISSQNQQILALQITVDATMKQQVASLQQWVQEYVKQQLGQ